MNRYVQCRVAIVALVAMAAQPTRMMRMTLGEREVAR
ncbi:hypothetical protein C7405_105304 [Paraburkholderia caballeronis]|nr:hypothetical protein C7405_105304 [Paraburkholderia caballeronis]